MFRRQGTVTVLPTPLYHSTPDAAAAVKILVLPLDLCSFDSVRAFADQFLKLKLPLDGLINNAGVMMQDKVLIREVQNVALSSSMQHF